MGNVTDMFKFRALQSLLQSRYSLATLAGKTFGGNRDLYATLGYKRALLYQDYHDRYLRGGIARRIITAKPSATWRRAPVITEIGEPVLDKGPEETEFGAQWKSLQDRLKVRQMLQRLDRVSGIGQFGVMLIGTSGSNDLKRPMPKLSGPDDVLYLSVFSENDVTIEKFVTDTTDPRYGQPLTYKLSVTSGKSLAANQTRSYSTTIEVHYSNVIHVGEGFDGNNVYGIPRLQPVWNLLDDLDKTAGGAAEAYWQVAHRGMHMKLDEEANLDPDDEAALSDEMDDFYNGLQRFIRTQGVELKPFQSETTDPRGVFFTTIALIAGVVDIPQRILIGSERGMIASEQDARNWNEIILERQENHAESIILRPFIDRLMSAGALKKIKSYNVEWPALIYQTENEKAEMAARAAQSINNVAKSMTLLAAIKQKPLITPREYREKYLGLPGEAPAEPLEQPEKKVPEIVQPPKVVPEPE